MSSFGMKFGGRRSLGLHAPPPYTYQDRRSHPRERGQHPTRHLSKRIFPIEVEGEGGEGRKRSRGKKTISTSRTKSIDFGSYFTDIGLKVEELSVEAPPASKKEKTIGEGKRFVYKYPKTRKHLYDLASTHSMDEIWELLVVALEFPDLRMVKIGAEHPVPSFYSLLARLDNDVRAAGRSLRLSNNILKR